MANWLRPTHCPARTSRALENTIGSRESRLCHRLRKSARWQATETALKEVPGKVTSMKIERYGKHNVYAVEIIATKDGVETDVFVDIEFRKGGGHG